MLDAVDLIIDDDKASKIDFAASIFDVRCLRSKSVVKTSNF